MSEPLRLQVGDWVADVAALRLEREGQSLLLEPRMMAVLTQLCRHAGEVVSADSLLLTCWAGQVLGDNPVHKVIAGLRKALGDAARTPTYIETIRQRGYRLVAPVRVLSGEGPRGHQDSWQGRSPFRGLAAFEREHADVFFGRDAAVATLCDRLTRQWERGHPMVIVLGPSGSGKSSLIQAGVVPALCGAAPGSVGAGLVAGAAVATADLGSAAEFGLWAMLAGAMLDWDWGDEPLLTGWSIDTLALALRDHPADVSAALDLRLQALGAPRAQGAPLLILERLEALFQLPDKQASQDFIARLGGWVQARQVIVLAACRNDFYAGLVAYPALMRDKEHGAHYDLAPLDAEGIAQIIRLPARAAGLGYGLDASGLNRLDDRLLTDALKAADALPLLQYTLQELYRRRIGNDELSWQAYDDMGGLEGAIGQVADQTLATLLPAEQAALGGLLPRLVGLSAQDQPPIGRWVPAADLTDAGERALVGALVQARLLVADHQGGAPGCRVAHEALLRRWPRVTAWVAEHRVTLALRDELQPWVQRWQAAGRAPALLLPQGVLLWQVAAALDKEPALFGDEARACIQGSLARLRGQARKRKLALAGVAGLALAAAFMAVRNGQLAEVANRREAQSRRLTSFMLGELADQLRPLNKVNLLASVAEQGLQVLGQKPTAQETGEERLQRAKALYVIGEVNGTNAKQQPGLARQAMGQARDLLASLKAAPGVDVDELFMYRTRVQDKLGTWATSDLNLDAAEKEWQEELRQSEQWQALRPSEFRALEARAVARNNLTWITQAKKGVTATEQHFRDTLPMFRELRRLRPQDRNAGFNFALFMWNFGELLARRGKLNEALERLDEGMTWYRERLAQDPADMELRRWLAHLRREQASVWAQRDELAACLSAATEAVDLFQKVAGNDPTNPSLQIGQVGMEMSRLRWQVQAGQHVNDALARWQPSTDPRLPKPVDPNVPDLPSTEWLVTQIAADMADGVPGGFSQATAAEARVARYTEDSDVTRYDLFGWLALQRLKSGQVHRDAERAAFCARVVKIFDPAVARGHGGELLEAWLISHSCALHPQLDPASWDRLTAGGYKPQVAAPSQRTTSGQRH